MMSSGCGNCDCADKSQCTKKRNTLQSERIVETSCGMREMEYPEAITKGENDCKCGPGCACTTCPCHK